MFNRLLKPLVITWLALFLSAVAMAAEDAQSDDPPDRVARLAYLQGAVSMQPAGTDDWAGAAVNRPLTTGDKLWVDRNSRAELQAGSATIHVDQGTGFSLLELSDNVLQMRVTDGAVNVNVRRLRDAEVIEIDTPTSAVTITQPGEYRIGVGNDGADTMVKTYSGECEVADNNRHISRVRAHQQVSVVGDQEAAIARGAFEPRDDFDAWANDRNQREQRSVSARYVAPDVIGYADLDDQGDWASENDYGDVWYPTHVAADWSPYRFGHWAWVAPWGWTWVDDAAWGFAPFHYGRWAFVRNRWGWVPGPIHVRAVYAPALVAWVGSPGGSISISIGGGVGWFPLAPREVYVPAYRCSERHLQNVNFANTVIVNRTIINTVYANRASPINYAYGHNSRAVTVVQRDAFVSARPVRDHRVTVNERELHNLQTQNIAPAIAPDRASTLGPHWNANAPRNIGHWNEREVVARHTPPARASFVQEQQAIRANAGRPVSRNQLWRSGSESRDVRSIDTPKNDAARNDGARNEAARNHGEANINPQVNNTPADIRPATPRRDDLSRRNQDRPPPSQAPQSARDNGQAGDANREAARRFDRGPQYRVDPRPQPRPEPAPTIQTMPRAEQYRSQAPNVQPPTSAPVVRAPERQPEPRNFERPQIERRVERAPEPQPQPTPQRRIERAPEPQPQAQPPPQPTQQRRVEQPPHDGAENRENHHRRGEQER